MLLLHSVTLAILPFAYLPAPVLVAAVFAVLLSYIHIRRRHILLSHPGSIRELVWLEGNHWQLTTREGSSIKACLLPRVYCQPWLVILHFRHFDGERSHIVLLADMLEADAFRRLRVRLLIEIAQIASPAL